MTIVNIILSNYDYINDYNYKVAIRLISYEPFWETLKNKKITTYTLITRHNISSATIDRIKKGGGITTAKLDDLCRILQCEISDIVKYEPD